MTTDQVSVNPNTDVITGLREAADWLEAHPELHRARGLVSLFPRIDDPREELTALARALGDAAVERVEDGYVYIEGWFGTRLRVMGSARVEQLGGVPATPRYAPIITPEYSVRIGAPAAGARQ